MGYKKSHLDESNSKESEFESLNSKVDYDNKARGMLSGN